MRNLFLFGTVFELRIVNVFFGNRSRSPDLRLEVFIARITEVVEIDETNTVFTTNDDAAILIAMMEKVKTKSAALSAICSTPLLQALLQSLLPRNSFQKTQARGQTISF